MPHAHSSERGTKSLGACQVALPLIEREGFLERRALAVPLTRESPHDSGLLHSVRASFTVTVKPTR